MDVLINLARKIQKLDQNDLLDRAINSDSEISEAILDLNREGQLFEKGINSEGESLKDIGGSSFTASGYSPKTLEIKEEKGQRTENITLKDTGAFYDSFELNLSKNEIYIEANPIKDDTNLFTEWGEEIVGLTEQSTSRIKGIVLTPFLEAVRKAIGT